MKSTAVRFQRLSRPTLTLAFGAFSLTAAHAQTPVSVPNYSFESPSTTFVTSYITDWTETPQPMGYDPASNGGYPWSALVGVFANDHPGTSDYIDNLDGSQAALLFAVPQLGFYQQLPATYHTGSSYQLTVGIVGQGGGIADGVTVDLQLYYLNSQGAITVIADSPVTENSTNFPNHTHAYDYTAVLPAVQSADAWAGQPIGIQILSTATPSNEGGYWDFDNVRLTELAAPEPGSTLLLALGSLALLKRPRGRAGLPR